MSKLVRLNPEYWPQGGYGHWCPGCNGGHEINVDAPNGSGARWSFNGDHSMPTFTPSVHIRVNPPGPHYQPRIKSSVCHYFLTNGMLHFLPDCTHHLAGKSVELPDIPFGKYMSCEQL